MRDAFDRKLGMGGKSSSQGTPDRASSGVGRRDWGCQSIRGLETLGAGRSELEGGRLQC
jgi:hypothetical protein